MPLTGFTIIDSLMLNTLGKAMVGVISGTTYIPAVDNPESKRFVAAYQAKFNALPDNFSDYGYVAGQAIAEALKATNGDTAKDKFAEAMVKVKSAHRAARSVSIRKRTIRFRTSIFAR